MKCEICNNNIKNIITLSGCKHSLCIDCLLVLKFDKCLICGKTFDDTIIKIRKLFKGNEVKIPKCTLTQKEEDDWNAYMCDSD